MAGHSMCPGCAAAITMRHLLKILGKKTILLLSPGCVAPTTAREDAFCFKVPAAHIGLAHGAAVAAGMAAAFELKRMEDITVVSVMGDGGTADIGLQGLSAAAERDDNILYLCIDNEGYMNTGRQGSASTPLGASTSTTPVGVGAPLGRDRPKKDLPLIMTDHDATYVATACPSYLKDFQQKVEKAKSIHGFKYLHILIPCPTGWGFDSDKTIELGRLAVKTGSFILCESECGRLQVTHHIKERLPIYEYLKVQDRFRHLKQEHVLQIQKQVDNRWNKYMRLVEE